VAVAKQAFAHSPVHLVGCIAFWTLDYGFWRGFPAHPALSSTPSSVLSVCSGLLQFAALNVSLKVRTAVGFSTRKKNKGH